MQKLRKSCILHQQEYTTLLVTCPYFKRQWEAPVCWVWCLWDQAALGLAAVQHSLTPEPDKSHFPDREADARPQPLDFVVLPGVTVVAFPSQNRRIPAWQGLEGPSVGHPAQPPAQAGSPRAGCTAPRPGGAGISPEKETPQPPWIPLLDSQYNPVDAHKGAGSAVAQGGEAATSRVPSPTSLPLSISPNSAAGVCFPWGRFSPRLLAGWCRQRCVPSPCSSSWCLCLLLCDRDGTDIPYGHRTSPKNRDTEKFLRSSV